MQVHELPEFEPALATPPSPNKTKPPDQGQPDLVPDRLPRIMLLRPCSD
jgi:hypothetical protein